MYHHLGGNSSSSSSSSCYGVDGDPILASRPDALLTGGSELVPPSTSSYVMLGQPSHGGVGGGAPRPSQQQLMGLLSPGVQSSFRRVWSTGDLQHGEQQDGQGGRVAPAPAARYSPEERRERIEKYRSKRNQRNFQKKITMKTLADSRPRVKGRFTRSSGDAGDYTEAESDAHHAAAAGIMESEMPPPVNVATEAVPEWWPAMQEALAAGAIDDELHGDSNLCDEEMLAAYLGVSSISLCSPSYSPSSSAWQ
ncbi:hypothetical protein ACP4OV_003560 [Aristida adscensionis]